MENTYLTALHGMEGVFENEEECIRKFHRKYYVEAFKNYYDEFLPILIALEEGYTRAIEKEIYLSNMAEALVKTAQNKISNVKRREVSNAKINLNMMMVVYVFPAIYKFDGSYAEKLVELLLEKWKEAFPESKLSAGNYEEIESGFHRKWCYITTAVCENLNKGDNCYELNLLREYRDQYLGQMENGESLIREYYDVAPTIVKRIDQKEDRDEIYQGIWKKYIAPCIEMIEQGQNEACCSLYKDMVHSLEEEYFYTN